jgi:hypothetical protein
MCSSSAHSKIAPQEQSFLVGQALFITTRKMKKLMFLPVILLLIFLSGFQERVTDKRTVNFPRQELKPETIPAKENLWVFILAGQSNMAGRGFVEPQDTIPHNRILSINKSGELIIAKEPLHFYEPAMTGLDSGLSFGRELIKHIPDSISVLLIPTAVGGSSIHQWVNDSLFRNVKLFSNFKEKVNIGQKYGTIRGILWHQGESDASATERREIYPMQLTRLFEKFRKEAGNATLPIFAGELGRFSVNSDKWKALNQQIHVYAETDLHTFVISTHDLDHNGDKVHFNSAGQRLMGQRFAMEFIRQCITD